MSNQRKRLSASLKKLAPDVTADDRAKCMKELKVSKVAISNNLRGRVSNNDVALLMIGFFSARIAQREEKIKKLCPQS